MQEDKVSIIIPAYNAENYISECIGSLVSQTYKNIEIIVVSDTASKDRTPEIVDSIANTDSRIVVVRQHGKKQGEARNGGLDVSTGHYIIFLDADDWLEPECCEVTVNEIVQSNAEIVFFDYIKEYGKKSVPRFAYKEQRLEYTLDNKEFFIYDMKTITPWGKLFLKDCIGNERFDENTRESEDVEFNFRIYGKVRKAVYIHKILQHYRVLESSAVHGFDNSKIQKFEYTINLIRQEMLDGDIDKAKAYYSFLAIIYIVLCQNCICLNPEKNIFSKCHDVAQLNKKNYFSEMFKNLNSVNIPYSRRIIPIMGKFGVNIGVLLVIGIKQLIVKSRR
ncbi:MAG: glycosyltransferase family 2 protein [Lachnospiraceae bacterium]|nr:glycosyltransferase family 2 protein [Lachnospiraceae bacterium]